MTQKRVKVLVPVEQIECQEIDWAQERKPFSRNGPKAIHNTENREIAKQKKVGITLHHQITEIEM